MQIQATTTTRAIDTAETGAPIAASVPAAASARKPVVEQRDSATAPPPAQRYSHWALISHAQQRIADTQASEQLLTQTYRELQQLGHQLGSSAAASGPGSSGSNTRKVAEHLRALDAQLAARGNLVDGGLRPKLLDAGVQRQRYVLDKIDLAAPKQADERVQLVFPGSGRGVTIDIPAASAGADVAARLARGLAPERIGVEYREDQLVFSAAPGEQRKLEEPVLISGTGVRVPAGNPIPLKLQPAPSELRSIANALGDSGSSSADVPAQQRLQKLLRSIEGSVRDLQAYRQQVMAQLQRASARIAAVSDQQVQKIQEELAGELRAQDFGAALAGIRAQAHTTRDVVVALLNR